MPDRPAPPDTPLAPPDILLRDYRPRSELRVRRTGPPASPASPAIDAHSHLGPTPFAGEWATRDAAALAAALDASGIAAIVDLDGGQGEALRRELDRWAPLGSRVAVFAGLDYAMWETRDDFGEEEARRLRAAVAAGARGLKVWKLLGLRARDPGGRLVPVDDRRLDPLWAAAGELGVPVTIHVADPIAFFRPLDATNERLEELTAHPDWHAWPTRPAGRPDLAGFPPFDELIDSLEAMVARHPAATFIGAHVGCAPEDLERVEAMLAACPNWHVDLAARIAELGRQPYTARELVVRRADRVLFGTDAPPDAAAWSLAFQFLETRDESFPYDPGGGPGSQGRWAVHGLGLPAEVLRLVYAANARRLLFRDLPGGAGGHVTLHLLPAERWGAWRADVDPAAPYEPAAYADEGFVHCTDGDPAMLAVANWFYAGEPGPLVVVDLDLALVGAPWRYDDPGSPYPHVYGPLRRDAVRGVRPVLRDAAGRFVGFGERSGT
jgi:predicted TIM-barrel fold metal-dependent hydrolase/uncharacterized protein (DUF952 family)